MTVWAILSDIHGREDRLARVLADAAAQGASRYLSLGDVGGAAPLDMLAEVGASHAFGNWEASGWRQLSPRHQEQVVTWPALLSFDGDGLAQVGDFWAAQGGDFWAAQVGDFWAAHASPVWPDGLALPDVAGYLQAHALHWTVLFPRLHRSDSARWAALAELEAANVGLFFHGHTHVQEAWSWRPGGAPTRLAGPTFSVPEKGHRVLVGVGSVGDPGDGPGACYALYNVHTRFVTWRRV